jgi:4'-phosphopantetheinyl transferase EntD
VVDYGDGLAFHRRRHIIEGRQTESPPEAFCFIHVIVAYVDASLIEKAFASGKLSFEATISNVVQARENASRKCATEALAATSPMCIPIIVSDRRPPFN